MSAFVTVETEESEEGVVIGAGDYAKGDLVELTALTSDEKYAFSGWYIGDELVSTDGIYRFTALENVAVRAEFERKYNFDDSFKADMSENCSEYFTHVYKNGDGSYGILITPFAENPADDMTVYFTSYKSDGSILSEREMYAARLGDNGCYDFENVDLNEVNSFLLKDEAGVEIAASNYSVVDRAISTVGKYGDSVAVTATVDSGVINVDFYFIDDAVAVENIRGYVVILILNK